MSLSARMSALTVDVGCNTAATLPAMCAKSTPARGEERKDRRMCNVTRRRLYGSKRLAPRQPRHAPNSDSSGASLELSSAYDATGTYARTRPPDALGAAGADDMRPRASALSSAPKPPPLLLLLLPTPPPTLIKPPRPSPPASNAVGGEGTPAPLKAANADMAGSGRGQRKTANGWQKNELRRRPRPAAVKAIKIDDRGQGERGFLPARRQALAAEVCMSSPILVAAAEAESRKLSKKWPQKQKQGESVQKQYSCASPPFWVTRTLTLPTSGSLCARVPCGAIEFCGAVAEFRRGTLGAFVLSSLPSCAAWAAAAARPADAAGRRRLPWRRRRQ